MLRQRLSYGAKNYSVLCIDEDLAILDFMKTNLSTYFRAVYCAQTSKEAMNLYRKDKIDIIVTDVGSGISDGIALATSIKEYDPKIKILLCTIHDDRDTLIKALKLGVDYYVHKPIDLEELYEGLLSLIRSLDIWLYQAEDTNVTIYESNTSNAKLFDYFTVMKTNKTMLKVVNYYKGVEIAHKAMILKVEEEKVYLIVDSVQYFAAKLEGKIILCSDILERDVQGKVGEKSLNVNDKFILELMNLTFLEFSPTKRKDVRITPDENLKINFIYQGSSIESVVSDISVNSVSLRIENQKKDIVTGDEVSVNISVKIPQQTMYHSFVQTDLIKCGGIIYKVDENNTYTQIVLMLKFTKSKDFKTMTDYLVKRQKDIIAEFRQIIKVQG